MARRQALRIQHGCGLSIEAVRPSAYALRSTGSLRDAGTGRRQDHLYALEPGRHYGWPYCYEDGGQVFQEDPMNQSFDRNEGTPSTAWRRSPVECSEIPRAIASFPAHSSPLGFARVPDGFADERLRGTFLVALHGPTLIRGRTHARGVGYRIVRIKPGQAGEDLVTGFLTGEDIQGRPCDIIVDGDRDILFTDDHKGVVYRLRYEGE